MGSRFAKCHCYSFSLKDANLIYNCHRLGPSLSLPTCPAQPLFRMGKFPNEDRFHRGLFVAPNRTDHQTPSSVKVLQLDAGSTFSFARFGHRITVSKMRRKPIYPMVPVWCENRGQLRHCWFILDTLDVEAWKIPSIYFVCLYFWAKFPPKIPKPESFGHFVRGELPFILHDMLGWR